VNLTNGMQGRVYAIEKGKPDRPVEVIPPLPEPKAAKAAEPAEDEPTETEGEPPPPSDNEGEAPSRAKAMAMCPAWRGAKTRVSPRSQRRPAVEVVQAKAAPAPPSGVKITLPAGHYKIIAEHSRADVGIEYRVHLGSAVLLPGMARSLPVPSTLPVLIPRDGTLRLRTEGEADVRCRLFDEKGRLVFEGSDNGPDWNCALAEPVTKVATHWCSRARRRLRARPRCRSRCHPLRMRGR
jgi:hypothetical protein